MRYRCKQAFYLPIYGDDGIRTDEMMTVKQGSIWELAEEPDRIIGGDVALNEIGSSQWIEISDDHFAEWFEVEE